MALFPMISVRRFAAVAGIAFLALAGSAEAQRKYTIKMDRARHVGQTYRVDTQVMTERRVSASVAGSLIERSDSSYSVRFVADAVVTALDAATNRPEITYTVRTCVHYGASDSIVLAPPGTRLVYTRTGDERHLRAADGNIDEESLNDIEDAVVEVGVGAEEMQINAGVPKAVGGTWDVSMDRLTKVFAQSSGFEVAKGGMTGKATLVSVTEAAPTPSMKVKVDIDLKKFTIPGLEKFKMTRSGAEINFLCDYPLDETKLPLEARLVMDFSIQATGKPQPGTPKVDLDMRFMRESKTIYSYD
jgi:hypothetical protein